MALLTKQATTITGTSPTFSAPSASDTISPDQRGVYCVRTTGTATTVVIQIPGNTDTGQAQPDISNTLGATDFKVFPMVGLVKYADATTGLLTVTHSGALTGVTSAYYTI